MKQVKKILYCIMMLICSTVVQSQSSFSQKYGTEADYKRLYFLNLQYTQSWVRSDTATYDKLLWADDFVHQNGADGTLIPKKALMILFGKPRFEKIEYFYPENISIQFISNDAALVFSRPPFRAVDQAGESYTQYNDVYVKRNGRWVCVSANITPVSNPGDKPATFSKVPERVKLISYSPGSEQDVRKLTELNAMHAEAFMRSRSELVEPMLADDFVLLSSNGKLYKRQDVIDQIKNSVGQNNVDTYSIENLNIRFVASDIAMVHAAAIMKFKDGKTSGVQYNDVYVNRGGKWICVSGNNTPIRN